MEVVALDWWHTRTDEELAGDAAALFQESFGGEPEGVWAAPGRVNLIGDHVDYAGGISVPFALSQNTAAAMAKRDDAVLRLVSRMPGADEVATLSIGLDEVGPLNPANWAGYAVGSVWAMAQAGLIPADSGLDIALVSDVPLGSGLSSSAALECAVALGAYELLTGETATDEVRAKLVSACIRAENEVVGASTGGLDQRSSLYGQRGKALALDFAADSVDLVPCDFAGAGLVLLIANTNAPHNLSDGQYGSRRGLVDEVQEFLGRQGTSIREADPAQVPSLMGRVDDAVLARRVRHVHSEIQRTAAAVETLKQADFPAFGEAMVASHESLRDDFEVVTDELESAFAAATVEGSVGARMTGGGFGGSVIALVRKDEVESVAQAIAEAASRQGFPAPSFLTALPSEGARRLR